MTSSRVGTAGEIPRRGERRRTDPLRSDWRWALRGRRKAPRRRTDRDQVAVDWYSPGLLAVTVGILVLSGLDATLTLILLESGAVVEANPFMRFLIDHDVQVFVNVKTVITGWALLVLVVCSHARFLRRLRVRWILHGILAGYGMLIGYELVLLRVTLGSW